MWYSKNRIRTLRSCALTCKAWLPRSRFHLFRTIVIHSAASCKAFQELVTSLPAIGILVRVLEIREYDGDLVYANGAFTRRKGCRVLWNFLSLLSIEPFLHLETLRLGGVQWSILDRPAQTWLYTSFNYIKSLQIYNHHFTNHGDLEDLSQGHPQLSHLLITGVSPTFEKLSLTTGSGRVSTLDTLLWRMVEVKWELRKLASRRRVTRSI